MAKQVCMGAALKCSFGAAPSSLTVAPTNRVTTQKPDATIMDFSPGANVAPFGSCTSLANPSVASATSAALGVLTPMPCMPVPTGPWVPGSPTVSIGGMKALNDSSKLMCSWGGVIEITNPGQSTVEVP